MTGRDPHAAPLADAIGVDDAEGWRMLCAIARDVRDWHRLRQVDGRDLTADDIASIAGRPPADGVCLAEVLVRVGLIDAVAGGFVPRDEPIKRLHGRIRTRKSRENATSSHASAPDCADVTLSNTSSPDATPGAARSRDVTASRVPDHASAAAAQHVSSSSSASSPSAPSEPWEVAEPTFRAVAKDTGFALSPATWRKVRGLYEHRRMTLELFVEAITDSDELDGHSWRYLRRALDTALARRDALEESPKELEGWGVLLQHPATKGAAP